MTDFSSDILHSRTNPLIRTSAFVAKLETAGAAAMLAAVLVLLLLNVVSRAIGKPFFWVDELAVYAMVWSAFLGASLAIRGKDHIAMTLLTDVLSTGNRERLSLFIDLILIAFLLAFGVTIWNWFDPIGLYTAGSFAEFSQTSFNFIYEEPTTTIGVSKFWFWLILPIFVLCSTIHLIANIAARVAAKPETSS